MTASRPTSLAGSSLVAVALWLLCCCAPASARTAGPSAWRCSRAGGTSGCAHALALASPDDSEAEEPEEELEEEAEEATAAEAEEEAGSLSGSPSNRAGALGGAVLSDLRLTAEATAALERHRPSVSVIGFSFTLSAPSKVRITLVEQTETAGQERWIALPDTLTVDAHAGQVSRDLTGHNRLSPGRYRLSVKPQAGRSRFIYLGVRR